MKLRSATAPGGRSVVGSREPSYASRLVGFVKPPPLRWGRHTEGRRGKEGGGGRGAHVLHGGPAALPALAGEDREQVPHNGSPARKPRAMVVVNAGPGLVLLLSKEERQPRD